MRRGFAWAAGLAGLLAAFFLRRRSSAPGPEQQDPAAELRRKLAAVREAEPASTPEPVVEEPAAPADADARRREVHEQARAAIDEMQGPPDPG